MSRRQTAGAPDHDLGTRAWRRSSRSGCEQLIFTLHQLPDFLERLVERAGGNMGIGGIDRDAGTRIGLAQQEALIASFMVNRFLSAQAETPHRDSDAGFPSMDAAR